MEIKFFHYKFITMVKFVIFLLFLGFGYFFYKQSTKNKMYATKRAGDLNKFTFGTPDKSPRNTKRHT